MKKGTRIQEHHRRRHQSATPKPFARSTSTSNSIRFNLAQQAKLSCAVLCHRLQIARIVWHDKRYSSTAPIHGSHQSFNGRVGELPSLFCRSPQAPPGGSRYSPHRTRKASLHVCRHPRSYSTLDGRLHKTWFQPTRESCTVLLCRDETSACVSPKELAPQVTLRQLW